MRLPELVRHGRPSLWLQFGCLAATLIMLFRWQSQLLLAYLASPWPLRARSSGRSVSDLTQFVNPLIGSIKGGHVFAGASTPFGSVKVVADSKSSEDAQPGFVDNGTPIYGFSQVHDDGTGGASSLGQFAFLPQACSFSATLSKGRGRCTLRRESRAVGQVPDSVRASPGLFQIALVNGVEARLTSTDHTALHAYRFSEPGMPPSTTNEQDHSLSPRDNNALGAKKNNKNKPVNGTAAPGLTLMLDLTGDLQNSFRGTGDIEVSLNETSQIASLRGSAQFQPSFGDGTFVLHFCATVPHINRVGIYTDAHLEDSMQHAFPRARDSGALLSIDTTSLATKANNTLFARIGISWKSQSQACRYQNDEIPVYDNEEAFNAVIQASRERWNRFMGGPLQVDLTGVDDDQRINFFSSLYRTGLAPTNITGDNPLWHSSEPYWDSFYCIWDSFRTTSPLTAILWPHVLAEQVRALIDIYRHTGFLPDCRMSLCKGLTQGGSNADTMLADAYVKGIRDGVNWTDGLAAMRKDAEVDPPDWGLEGRGGIKARQRLGYVPMDGDGDSPIGRRVVQGRTASRTLEYVYNDFGIALVAAGEGDNVTYEKYLVKSRDWYNLWDANRTLTVANETFRGFINARHTDGSFSYLEDVRKCSPAFQFGRCYLVYAQADAQFYEGSAYQYSFAVPHDTHRVVKLMGGDAAYIKRLEVGWDKMYNDIGDEMGFLPNFQYNYAVGGYRYAVDRSLKTLRTFFNTTTSGLPGNDDSGATSAYVVFTGLGLFPVSGTSVYLLTTPLFPSFSILSGISGKRATVTTQGWDGAKVNKYVQFATLNGKPFTRNWISHQEFFLSGATLHLVLGSEPTSFGSTKGDLPPSLSAGAFQFATAGHGL